MIVFRKRIDITKHITSLKDSGLEIGFVPTMGALHEGHISLIDSSNKENDVTVASIFVNPIQFNNKKDLKHYPRDEKGDLRKLENAGCDIVFIPDDEEMYPDDVNENYDLGGLDKIMEGVFRPGHFQGVAIVVKRLFETVPAHNAYFGKKDFQQLAVIKYMVQNLGLKINITGCETVREPDGLAKSSRNLLLDKKNRSKSAVIPQTLFKCKALMNEMSVQQVKDLVKKEINSTDPLQLEYFQIVDEISLKPIKAWNESNSRVACIAVWAGNVRLIDNITL